MLTSEASMGQFIDTRKSNLIVKQIKEVITFRATRTSHNTWKFTFSNFLDFFSSVN